MFRSTNECYGNCRATCDDFRNATEHGSFFPRTSVCAKHEMVDILLGGEIHDDPL